MGRRDRTINSDANIVPRELIRQDLADQIAASIEKMIVNDQLRVGDKLPSERKLSELFGVSRATLRDATHLLEQRGLVIRKTGSGTYIRDMPNTMIGDSISRFFTFGAVSHDSVMDLRLIMEPEIAARAAMHATPEQIEKLHGLIVELETLWESRDPISVVEPDVRFHEVLAESSGNALLHAISIGIHQLMRTLLQAQNVRVYSKQALASHRAIHLAVKNGDPEKARQAMKEHIGLAIKSLSHDKAVKKNDKSKARPRGGGLEQG